MDVTVGVMAYNEEKNIARLLDALLKQKTKEINIKEIIVVSSGSTDETDGIVRDFCKRSKSIKLVSEPERKGKSRAINLFLRKSKSDVLVLVSGDVIPKENVVERLCSVLNSGIGISVGRPIPERTRGFLGGVVDLQWKIQHEISMRKPKFGEMIVFRRVFDKINDTAVDEEFIGMFVQRKGLGAIYVPGATVRNRGPRCIKDFIKQRRRIYAGHLDLRRGSNYSPPTLSNIAIFRGFLNVRGIEPGPAIGAFLLELISRMLGVWDFLFNKKRHIVWKMIKR